MTDLLARVLQLLAPRPSRPGRRRPALDLEPLSERIAPSLSSSPLGPSDLTAAVLVRAVAPSDPVSGALPISLQDGLAVYQLAAGQGALLVSRADHATPADVTLAPTRSGDVKLRVEVGDTRYSLLLAPASGWPGSPDFEARIRVFEAAVSTRAGEIEVRLDLSHWTIKNWAATQFGDSVGWLEDHPTDRGGLPWTPSESAREEGEPQESAGPGWIGGGSAFTAGGLVVGNGKGFNVGLAGETPGDEESAEFPGVFPEAEANPLAQSDWKLPEPSAELAPLGSASGALVPAFMSRSTPALTPGSEASSEGALRAAGPAQAETAREEKVWPLAPPPSPETGTGVLLPAPADISAGEGEAAEGGQVAEAGEAAEGSEGGE